MLADTHYPQYGNLSFVRVTFHDHWRSTHAGDFLRLQDSPIFSLLYGSNSIMVRVLQGISQHCLIILMPSHT